MSTHLYRKIIKYFINCHFYTNVIKGTLCKWKSVYINITKLDITAYDMIHVWSLASS